jgi:hypothetical protein
MTTTPHLALPLIAAAQAQKHVTHNEALFAIDALLQCAVKDRDLAAPPASPAEGDRYIVAASPTGAWAGQAKSIAAWQDGAWRFHAPKPGFIAFVVDETSLYHFNGSEWAPGVAAISALQSLALLGVGTTADATNPFAAKLNKALWTAKAAADGGDGDLRCTFNKETAADVLSLLLQSGFSGRAELGLLGDADFRLKVSSDGTSWTDALRVRNADGLATLAALAVTGAATMSGNLTVSKHTPTVVLNESASGQDAIIFGGKGGLNRWAISLGDTAAESGSNTGSGFGIFRYNDAGAYVDTPLSIDRATGNVSIAGRTNFIGNIGVGSPANAADKIVMASAAPADVVQRFFQGGVREWWMGMKSGSLEFRIGVNGGTASTSLMIDGGNHLVPGSDNTQNLGSASLRYSTVYAGTGTINTSDETEKTIAGEPDDAFFEAILSVPLVLFQWNDALERKGGEGARLHYGPGAQAVRDALLARGKDPARYALFCSDPLYAAVKKARSVERPVMHVVERQEIVLEGGKAVRRTVTREEPLVRMAPLHDEAGSRVTDDAGAVVTVPVPVSETVLEEYEGMEPTGEERLGLRLDQFDRARTEAIRRKLAKLETA